jgi:NitT/TauT family transport system substrate-binding protein
MIRKLISTAALFAALAMPGAANAQEKFTFALNWFPVGDHAAYWVALEKGYFAEKGLDVTLENSKGSGDSIAKVDSGRADAGLADAAVIIGSRARGTTIKMVGMIFDKTPMNVFSSKDAPITEPKQLEGKTIAAPPGDSQRQMWPAFAKANGIDESKVTWINIEPTAKVAALAEKRADAVSDYTTGQPMFEKPMGKGNVVALPWSQHGFDMYSMSIMASEATMTERPEVLKAFLEAAYKGWQDVMKDPQAALTIFKKRVPEIDETLIGENMLLGLDLMATQRYKDHGIGWMDEAKMCDSVELVNTYMQLPSKVACADVFTNDFLTKIDMPLDVK